MHLIPLFVYFALGQCLQESRGQYHPGYLPWLVLLLPTVAAYWMWVGADSREQPSWTWWIPIYGLQCLSLALEPGCQNASEPTLQALLGGLLWANCGAAWLAHLSALRKRYRLATLLISLSLASLLLARIVIPPMSPKPFIDVFTIGTEGTQRFLQGQNPYAGTYPDIYHGQYAYRPVYIYWPTGLLLQSLAYQLGDIRYAFVACDGLLILLLYGLASGPPLQRMALPALWLSFPVSLSVLENAWIDTLLVFFVALTLFCLRRGLTNWAGVALGLLCGVKQYAVVFPLLYAPVLWRRYGWGTSLRAAIAFVSTFLAIMLPFAVWDLSAFRHNTIDAVGQLPMRPDALTLQAWLLHVGGWSVWQVVVSILYVLALVGLGSGRLPFHPLCEGPAVMFMVIFLLGKQAFLNYYDFLSFLILLATFAPQPVEQGSSDSEMNSAPLRSD